MHDFMGAEVQSEIKNEVMILLKNAPILTGRSCRMEEAGLALGVFLYWRLGFDELSPSEREDSALYILNDCGSVLHVLYGRLVADGLTPPVPKEDLEVYINSQIREVASTWGAINNVSHIFAESYLKTNEAWPVPSSWENVPTLARLDKREFCQAIYLLVRDFCSERTAEAILPVEVIRADDGPDGYGRILATNFMARQKSKQTATSSNGNKEPLTDSAKMIGLAAGGLAGLGIAAICEFLGDLRTKNRV